MFKSIVNYFKELFSNNKKTTPPPTQKPEVPVEKPVDKPVEKPQGLPTEKELLDFISLLINKGWKGSVQYGPYINEREDKGANRSPFLDAMIKRQGGGLGDAYCVYTQQDVMDAIEERFDVVIDIPEGGNSQNVWRKTKDKYKIFFPKPVSLTIWYYNDESGHCGMALTGADSKRLFETFEGNTSSTNSEVVRNGEGFYYKTRSTDGTSKMKLRGWIDIQAAMIKK